MKEKNKKEIKQKTLDLEGFVKTLEDQVDKGYVGTITEINPTTNSIYFGDKSTFDEREGIAITVLVDDEFKTEFTSFIGLPKNVRGFSQSSLYAFKKAYNCVPKIDLKVNCIIDENGFYRIKY